jgi:hypothetical protein
VTAMLGTDGAGSRNLQGARKGGKTAGRSVVVAWRRASCVLLSCLFPREKMGNWSIGFEKLILEITWVVSLLPPSEIVFVD